MERLTRFVCELIGHKIEESNYPGKFPCRCARCHRPIWKKEEGVK